MVEKPGTPDQRSIAVVPIRAITDKDLGDATFRALAMLCSYCNRAGITWVSQKTMAEQSKMSQQAISKHIKKLQEHGYVEVVRKGFRGERATTCRVIFDKSVDTNTAISITSKHEDNRPPHMQEDQQINPEGQRRIAQLIQQAMKPMSTKKEYSMTDKDTLTVRKMKEEIAQKKPKKQASKGLTSTTSEVVNVEASHSQPTEAPFTTSFTTSEVVENTENTVIGKSIKVNNINKVNTVLNNQDRIELNNAGLSDEQIEDNLTHLLDAYKAEGLTPNPKTLVAEIIALAGVGR